MKYQFSFYNPADYPELKELVLASYRWDPAPSFGLSRLEFSAGLHPGFTGHRHAWEQSIGLYRHNGAIVAAICNEGVHSGETFFFFDSPQRAEDAELVQEMIRFAKTYGAGVKSDGRTRYVDLHIPPLEPEPGGHGEFDRVFKKRLGLPLFGSALRCYSAIGSSKTAPATSRLQLCRRQEHHGG